MWLILFCLLLSLANSAKGSEVPKECFELFRQVRQQNIFFIPFIYNKIVFSFTPGESSVQLTSWLSPLVSLY
jgi:hypothetical protein